MPLQETSVKAHTRKRKRSSEESYSHLPVAEVCEHKLDEDERICPKCRKVMTASSKITKDLLRLKPELAELVRQSFLKEYPVEVHYNTIDRTVFKPTPSDFRKRYGLQDKIMVLGVASVWDERKGLDDFVKLAGMLDDRYAIVLVGLSDKQIRQMPKNILGLGKTNSAVELAQIYTAADILVNPSREETFGMTILEASACGTKAIVYKSTACEEVAMEHGGYAVDFGVSNIRNLITRLGNNINTYSGGAGADLYRCGFLLQPDIRGQLLDRQPGGGGVR